ncbi:hypothetical protein EVAR_18460_1 [Eumeta japonica]|uniref:Transducer of regulated CREB activity C-terminal domain-containing protein n=1 Tax=Eumeta variegata TaxID=151549 RepID=A0A4C1UZM2_EUMVA|nr:hypothetical protein EVAR_18460_1 [Eumeta japonica]
MPFLNQKVVIVSAMVVHSMVFPFCCTDGLAGNELQHKLHQPQCTAFAPDDELAAHVYAGCQIQIRSIHALQASHRTSPVGRGAGCADVNRVGGAHDGCGDTRSSRDPVPGGNGPVFPLTSPTTPTSIPDIILTDYSGELDAGIFGGEEAQLRAGLDLDDLTLLEEPSALLPDSAVEHEFRLDRL